MQLVFRKALLEDYQAILSLVKLGLEEFGFRYQKETSEYDLENFEEVYLRSNYFLVCTLHKQIIATGGLNKINSELFKIKKMYVDCNYRRFGIGTKMFLQLEQHAIKQGAKILILETSSKMVNAIKLYKSLGFQKTNIKPESQRCDISMIKKNI